eukprot:5055110-Ditylum_brightwellii.AAC.1
MTFQFNLSNLIQDELNALIQATEAASKVVDDDDATAATLPSTKAPSLSSWSANVYPTYKQYYSNKTIDQLYDEKNANQLDFMHYAKHLNSTTQVEHKLMDICTKLPQSQPVFLVCEHPQNQTLHLVILHGMNHHQSSLLSPTQWDDSLYAFIGDTALGNAPATIEFDKDWLEPVDTATYMISTFKKAIPRLALPLATITVKTTSVKVVAPA